MTGFNSNRRRFLQASTLAGVGFWTSRSLRAADAKSPNERIRFACIGVMGKGESDTEDAARLGEVVAICDIDEERLGAAAAKYPNARKFDDWRKLYDAMANEIDAVTVSTPDHSHAVAAAAGMRLGKHAFVQKPLTHDIYEARTLAQIAREQKLATQMGNQGTAGRPLRTAAAMVQAGVLGPVSEVYVWTNRPVWDQGKPRSPEKPVPKNLNWDLFLGPAPKRPYSEDYHPFSWRGWWDFGTGSLGDMGCHTMNLPYMALDLRNPVGVQAETTGHNRDSYPSKSRVTYEFAATERHPALKMHWLDGEQTPPAELLQNFNEGAKKQGRAGGETPEKFEASGALLIGEKGMLYAPGDYAGSFMLSGVEPIEAPFEESIGHFDEFIRAIKGGKPAASNFPDYAGPLTETVLLGNLACWVANEPGTPGKKIEWDAKNMQATNAPELASLVRRQYRAGYSI